MAKGKKTGGRRRGAPNKVTQETRGVIKEIVDNELSNVPVYLKKLSYQARLEMLVKLLPYVAPKMNFVKFDGQIPIQGVQNIIKIGYDDE